MRRSLTWLNNAGSWAKALVSEAVADTLAKSLRRRGSGACWRAALISAQERGINVFAQNLAATLLGKAGRFFLQKNFHEITARVIHLNYTNF